MPTSRFPTWMQDTQARQMMPTYLGHPPSVRWGKVEVWMDTYSLVIPGKYLPL